MRVRRNRRLDNKHERTINRACKNFKEPVNPQPITLEGSHVQLQPLSESHHDALCEVGLDPELWKWIPIQVLDRER